MNRKNLAFARRWQDDPIEIADATVILIDALREFIRSDAELTESLVIEGEITREQAQRDYPSDIHARALLAELETWQVNMNLNGILRRRPKR